MTLLQSPDEAQRQLAHVRTELITLKGNIQRALLEYDEALSLSEQQDALDILRDCLTNARPDALTGILTEAVQAQDGLCLICKTHPALYCGAGCANRGR